MIKKVKDKAKAPIPKIIKRKHIVKSKKQAEGYETITGHYSKVKSKIFALIIDIATNTPYSNFYIGATEDLDTRWSKYKDWEFKHVLYETSICPRLIETELITFAKKNIKSCNADPFSKGLKEGAERYYLYILGDKSCKLRK